MIKKVCTILVAITAVMRVNAQNHKINHFNYSFGNLRTVSTATCPASVDLSAQDSLGNNMANGETINQSAAPFYISASSTGNSTPVSPCIETIFANYSSSLASFASESISEGGVDIYDLCSTCGLAIGGGNAVLGSSWSFSLYGFDPNQEHQFTFCRTGSIATTTVSLADCWTRNALPVIFTVFSNNTTTITPQACDTIILPPKTDIGTATFSIAPATGTVGLLDYNNGTSYIHPAMLAGGTYTVTYTFAPPAMDGCNTITNTYMFTINAPNTTGVEQVTGINNRVTVYPNPSNGTFAIEATNTAKQLVEVYDLAGRLILSQTITGATTINANELTAGVYYLKVSGAGMAVNQRIVIAK